jgi:hypothetical protein
VISRAAAAIPGSDCYDMCPRDSGELDADELKQHTEAGYACPYCRICRLLTFSKLARLITNKKS